MAGNAILDQMIGPHKAALLLRAIGEDRARKLMSMMSAEEMHQLTRAMDKVGVVDASDLERFFDDFAERILRPTENAQAMTKVLDEEVKGTAPQSRPNMTDFTTRETGMASRCYLLKLT